MNRVYYMLMKRNYRYNVCQIRRHYISNTGSNKTPNPNDNTLWYILGFTYLFAITIDLPKE